MKNLHEILDPFFECHPNTAVAVQVTGRYDNFNSCCAIRARWMLLNLQAPNDALHIESPCKDTGLNTQLIDEVLLDPAARVSAELWPKFVLNVDLDGYHFEVTGDELSFASFAKLWSHNQDWPKNSITLGYFIKHSGSRLMICATKQGDQLAVMPTPESTVTSVPEDTTPLQSAMQYSAPAPEPEVPAAQIHGNSGALSVNELEDTMKDLAARVQKIQKQTDNFDMEAETEKLLANSRTAQEMYMTDARKQAVDAMLKQAVTVATENMDPDHFDDEDELFEAEAEETQEQSDSITGGKTESTDPRLALQAAWMKKFNQLPLIEQKQVIGTDESIPMRLDEMRKQFYSFDVATQARISHTINSAQIPNA